MSDIRAAIEALINKWKDETRIITSSGWSEVHADELDALLAAHPPSPQAWDGGERRQLPAYSTSGPTVYPSCQSPDTARLREAFVAGAKWWEFESTGGTMWQSDQGLAYTEVLKRYPPAGDKKLTTHQADAIEAEMRRLEADPSVTKHALRLFMQYPMPCGHAAGNLLTCDRPPNGCVICGPVVEEKGGADGQSTT